MDTRKNCPTDVDALRLRAEELFKERQNAHGQPAVEEDARILIHELQIQQIELEMRIEELVQEREILELSRDRYMALYDFAPVGYLTLDRDGTILDANLTAARLFGAERSGLVGRSFSSFVSGIASPILAAFLKRAFESRAKESCEATFLMHEPSPLCAHIEAIIDGDAALCHVAVMDITEQRSLTMEDEGLNLQRKKLEDELAIRKRAEEEMKRKAEQLSALSRKAITAQEEERKRLARELHDSLGQKIISMKLNVEWLKNRGAAEDEIEVFTSIEKLTVEAAEELHQICWGLRPLLLDRIGFAAAIKALFEEFELNSEMTIEAEIEPVDETDIPAGASIHLYRILQESLTNIIRHSNTKKAFVSLREEDSSIVMNIKDNGCGMAADETARKYGFGILGMIERANMCGARFEIESSPGKGVRIRVMLPIRNPMEGENHDTRGCRG